MLGSTGLLRPSDIDFTSSSVADSYAAPLSVLDHLINIVKLWWRHMTMRVTVPSSEIEYLTENCGLTEKHIVHLYKQFRMLVSDSARDYLTVKDLERHSPLLASNPLKRYSYRMLFWTQDKLTFREFVTNLSLTMSNCIGSPNLHLIKNITEASYFHNVSNPRDVAQMQKLLALYNCFDLRGTGNLDTDSLGPLLYDLLRCDSDVSVSSLVPHSMIRRMVNTTIATVHTRFPSVCYKICGDELDKRTSVDPANQPYFDGHRMMLTKELFIRDQENLHLDQLMSMRL